MIKIENLKKSLGEKEIFNDISFVLNKGEKIGIIGKNGSGKTTFIKILLEELIPKEGEIKWNPNIRLGYLPQEIIFRDDQKTILEYFEKDTGIPENEGRRILGRFLFSGTDQLKKIKDLSLGEKRRLYLAKIVASGSNLLLLDEPTNHLDILSIESIEKALFEFEGAILIISHDRYFLKNIGTKRFYHLKEGNFEEFYSIEDLEKII